MLNAIANRLTDIIVRKSGWTKLLACAKLLEINKTRKGFIQITITETLN